MEVKNKLNCCYWDILYGLVIKPKKSNCNLLLLGLKATNVKLYAIIPLVRTVNWLLVALDQRVLHKIVLQGAKCLNAAQTKQIKVIVLASIGNFTISSTIK